MTSECLPISLRGQMMSTGTRRRDYQDYHRPLATYSEEERNRILESKAQRRARHNYTRSLRVRFLAFLT